LHQKQKKRRSGHLNDPYTAETINIIHLLNILPYEKDYSSPGCDSRFTPDAILLLLVGFVRPLWPTATTATKALSPPPPRVVTR
jgi:hypothetical protein